MVFGYRAWQAAFVRRLAVIAIARDLVTTRAKHKKRVELPNRPLAFQGLSSFGFEWVREAWANARRQQTR
jgi:hypothetical protein